MTGAAGKKLKKQNRLLVSKSIPSSISYAITGGVNEIRDEEPLF